MSVSARARRVAIVLGVVLAVVTAPVWAQALSGLVPTSGSVPMETNSGLTVTVGGASDLAGSDFLNDETLFIQTEQGNLTAEAIASAEATVQAGDIEGTYTNVTAIDATSAQILLAPDDKANLTVSGGVTDAEWRDYGTDTGETAAVISGSGSSTITAYGLPSDTRVWAIDAQTGQLVAQDVTDANGDGIFSFNASTGTHAVAVPNGEIKQSWSDTDRHLRFVTGNPAVQLDASAVATDGMNVTVTGTGQLETDGLFPFSNTVNATVGNDYVEFTASGTAAATVADTDLEGDFTNITAVDASSTTITADPGDKPQLSIAGAADAVAWSDYAPDDGEIDTVISGPDGTDTTLTYQGLTDGLTVTAVNASTGTPLDVGTVDSFGQLEVTIPHSESQVLLQSGDQTNAPSQSNPSPVGDQSTEPSQFSVDVSDLDFPDDNVSVTIHSDGSQVHQEYITTNSTVTVSMPASALTGGEHDWTVNATDRFGNSEIQTYEYTIPSQVYIYNETKNATDQHELIEDTANVRATLTGSDGLVVEQTVSNGVFNLSGYDPTQTYVLTVETGQYFVRSVYLPNLYEQQAIFLLNESRPNTESLISLDDRTGNFDDNPVLQTQRVINTSNVSQTPDNGYQWVTVAGDRLGADNQFQAHFEKNKRYRFKVVNTEGDERVLGEYTAEFDGPISLEIGTINYQFSDEATSYEWDIKAINESGSPVIRFAYTDHDNKTESLELEIRNRDTGAVIDTASFDSGPYGEIVYTSPISTDQYNNETFEVEWSADRGDETVGATEAVGGQRLLNLPIDSLWLNVTFGAVALLLAFLVGAGVHPAAGGITVAGWSGIAWFFGLVPAELGAGAVILAFAISIWMLVQQSNQGVPT